MNENRTTTRGRGDAPDTEADQVTRLIKQAVTGEPRAARELLPLVYRSLHDIAERQMRLERPGHTLQATALVHEAYVRLVSDAQLEWDGRGHFYAAAAEAMRRILIDHARRVGAAKRGGGWQRGMACVADLVDENVVAHAIELDDAIEALRKHDPRAASVVQLRFYAGLSVEQTAAALNVAPRTVDRDWRYARGWLCDRLQAGTGEDEGR